MICAWHAASVFPFSAFSGFKFEIYNSQLHLNSDAMSPNEAVLITSNRGQEMYIVSLFVVLLILPILSIAIHVASGKVELDMAVIGKWFVFWAVGIRLFTAGFSQMFRPKFTAEKILGIKDPKSFLVVRELGFANLAIGTVGMGSILDPTWIVPSAISGAIFYSLAGVNHVMTKERNKLENMAMITDLFVAGVLFAFCLSVAIP